MSEKKKLKEIIKKLLPIVEDAYWDHATAWSMPGSGYNHKAQSRASRTFDGKLFDNSVFEKFVKETKELIE